MWEVCRYAVLQYVSDIGENEHRVHESNADDIDLISIITIIPAKIDDHNCLHNHIFKSHLIKDKNSKLYFKGNNVKYSKFQNYGPRV